MYRQYTAIKNDAVKAFFNNMESIKKPHLVYFKHIFPPSIATLSKLGYDHILQLKLLVFSFSFLLTHKIVSYNYYHL